MKYKVGDKVRIKSLDWYNENKTIHGDIWFDNAVFVGGQSLYCGCELTIRLVTNDSYYVIENDYYWIDEMIEGLVEEEEIEFTEEDKYWCDIMSESDPTTYVLPQGYQFVDENGNVINAQKIVLEKKKKEYPKTFKECCVIVGDTLKWDNPFRIHRDTHPYIKHLDKIIESFCQLLICRDAYWKIAGDEMGLGKPWEPDWKGGNQKKYCIYNDSGDIRKGGWFFTNAILAFPTEEMRDAFYENFKELIEQCKELL